MSFRRKMTFFRMEVGWARLNEFRPLGPFDPGVPKLMKTLLMTSTRGVWGETW